MGAPPSDTTLEQWGRSAQLLGPSSSWAFDGQNLSSKMHSNSESKCPGKDTRRNIGDPTDKKDDPGRIMRDPTNKKDERALQDP